MDTNGNSNGTNGTELKVPDWIDADYFKDILVLDGKSKWKYVSHEVRMANEKGENYASVLYRVKVVAENEANQTEELSYILKIGHSLEGPTKEMMDIFNVFGKEVEMYRSVVPNFEQLLQKSGDFTQFSPKCLKTSTPQVDQIVLEDLSKKGFKMASRHDGLDMDHVKLVLERLSKFHAVSAVYQENNGPYSDDLLKGMYNNEKLKPMMDEFFSSNLAVMKESVSTFPNGERYVKQMENYVEKCFDKCNEITTCDPNGFNVLNHGDLWTNNILFKYDQGKVSDMLFIDLQLSVYGSPAIDLHYFIISSAQKNLKINEFDTIVQYYHENLVKSLKHLGYKKHIPTLLELQIDLLQKGFLGLMAAITVLPIVVLKDCEDADINNMMDSGDAGTRLKRAMFFNPGFVIIYEMLLEYYDKKGILKI